MIPISAIDELTISNVQQPSKTYGIDFEKGVVAGYIGDLDSIRQAVRLIMLTERYAYPIYSWNYGVELESLIGKDAAYITAEIKRRIREALEQDDRVKEISGFNLVRNDDELLVEFEVVTDYAKFISETVVKT